MLRGPVPRWMPALCLAGVLAGAPLAGQDRPAPVPVRTPEVIAVQASSMLPALPAAQLAESVAWLLGEWYGDYVTGRAAAAGQEWRLQLSLTPAEPGLQLLSELRAPSGEARTRSAWLPAGSLAAVTATAVADSFWLWSQFRRFPYLAKLAPAPTPGPALAPQALSRLIQRPVTAAEVHAAATYAGGIMVLLPDGPLALGTRFEIIPDTILWLTWRDRSEAAAGAWRSFHRLGDGRLALEPEAGPLLLVDPHQQTSAALAESPPAAPGTVAAALPAALLAVAPTGAAVWHRPGRLTVQDPRVAAPATTSLALPFGSVAPGATTTDGRGAVWIFDPRERRIRVFAPGPGAELRQLFAVTPLLPREELVGVQTLALTTGGHLLLGSRGAIWKLDQRGVPVWSLRLLHTRPRQRLPQAFTVVAQVDEPAFLLLDRTSGILHRFTELPEPPPAVAPVLLRPAAAAPANGALLAALTDHALGAADHAWERYHLTSTQRLLGAANRYLDRWRAADPLAGGVDRRTADIDRFGDSVEQALYGEPLFAVRIAPGHYHPGLRSYYGDHPFALTLRNLSGSAVETAVELGVAGAARSATVVTPTIAAGKEATVPVHLLPDPAQSSTDLPREVSLWLRATSADTAAAALAPASLTLVGRRCVPAEAAAAPAGAASAAFLRWHMTADDTALAGVAAPALAPGDLTDAVARLAEVVTEAPSCAVQPVAHTLASLSGTATDWALALTALLTQRGVPAALLLTADARIMTIMGSDESARVGDPDSRLDPTTAQQLRAGLADAGMTFGPGPISVLLPQPAAATGTASGAAWRAAGARAAAAALAPGGAPWRLVAPLGSAGTRSPAWPVVLPLGAN